MDFYLLLERSEQ